MNQPIRRSDPTHTVTEAVDVTWRGSCGRHAGTHPEDSGVLSDLRDYEAPSGAIETWDFVSRRKD